MKIVLRGFGPSRSWRTKPEAIPGSFPFGPCEVVSFPMRPGDPSTYERSSLSELPRFYIPASPAGRWGSLASALTASERPPYPGWYLYPCLRFTHDLLTLQRIPLVLGQTGITMIKDDMPTGTYSYQDKTRFAFDPCTLPSYNRLYNLRKIQHPRYKFIYVEISIPNVILTQ